MPSVAMMALPERPRILVITLRRLGDVLLTTPLIRSLRRAWPDARIEVLVFAETASILDGNPDIDRVVAGETVSPISVSAPPAAGEPYALDLGQLYSRELTVRSTYSSTPADLARALDLLASGAVRADGLVTHRLPLDRFAEGVELQRSGGALKVLFYPGDEA